MEASSSKPKQSLIDSALRTLEAGSGGIAALAAAMQDGLGQPFLGKVEPVMNVGNLHYPQAAEGIRESIKPNPLVGDGEPLA